MIQNKIILPKKIYSKSHYFVNTLIKLKILNRKLKIMIKYYIGSILNYEKGEKINIKLLQKLRKLTFYTLLKKCSIFYTSF